jgi:succinoglycan biosynthesis protein ExoM
MEQGMEISEVKRGTNFSNKIIIGLCTYHRNELLDGALESLSRIDLPPGVEVEFVLVDNDADGGAMPVFESYVDAFPFKSHYVIEPNQGLVCARNRVIEEALKLEATEIAFFDDDEIVESNWLTALWNGYLKNSASGVGGSVYRLLPLKHDPLLEKFWSGDGSFCLKDDAKGLNMKFLISTNNCLFSTHLVRPDGFNLRFDPFFNQIGGEDGKFALDALKRGAMFFKVMNAITIERFPEERATFRYLVKRHFGKGNLLLLLVHRIRTEARTTCHKLAIQGICSIFSITIKCFPEERATFGYLVKRYFGKGNFLPLVVRRMEREVKALRYKLAIQGICSMFFRVLFLPISPCFGRFKFWHNIFKLTEAVGVICGFFGCSYRYYKPRK